MAQTTTRITLNIHTDYPIDPLVARDILARLFKVLDRQSLAADGAVEVVSRVA